MRKNSIILTVLFFTWFLVGGVKAQDRENSKPDKQEYDRNLEITKKPRVSAARFCSQSSGITTVRATFDKSGKVTAVEVVSSSGCKAFDSNAVSAAKKIKFKPAIKDGEPVTVTKLVQYSFAIYIR